MAGHNFNPRTAWLELSVKFSSHVADVHKFTRLVARVLDMLVLSGSHKTIKTDGGFAERIVQCLRAFDRIDQNMQRPVQWAHWTHDALAEPGNDPYYNRSHKRLPSGYGYSSFISLVSRFDHRESDLITTLMENQFELLTMKQKHFLLGTLLVPDFYHIDGCCVSAYHSGLSSDKIDEIILVVLKEGIDVNHSTKRSGCRLNYSVWQFFFTVLARLVPPG